MGFEPLSFLHVCHKFGPKYLLHESPMHVLRLRARMPASNTVSPKESDGGPDGHSLLRTMTQLAVLRNLYGELDS